MLGENDMALRALLKAAEEVDPTLDTELLRKTFAIQRRHQFDSADTREQSMKDLKTLLEATIDEARLA
jgi:hypothetical protein